MNKPVKILIKNLFNSKGSFLVIVFLFSLLSSMAQSDNPQIHRNNFIKINLISLPPLINNLNQQWIGLQYQRLVSDKLSISMTVDLGQFEDYSYTKYHDYFDEYGGFSFTREDVVIPGFHLIPAVDYYVFISEKISGQGLYIGGRVDYYQYNMKKTVFESSTNQTSYVRNSTSRFDVGLGVGGQYVMFSRLSVDLNISIFTKILANSSNQQYTELYPENAFWKSNDNSTWSTINFMIGYAFGSSKRIKAKN